MTCESENLTLHLFTVKLNQAVYFTSYPVPCTGCTVISGQRKASLAIRTNGLQLYIATSSLRMSSLCNQGSEGIPPELFLETLATLYSVQAGIQSWRQKLSSTRGLLFSERGRLQPWYDNASLYLWSSTMVLEPEHEDDGYQNSSYQL